MKRFSLCLIALIYAGISFSQTKVIPISDKDFKTNKNVLLYYLPKTEIDIDITVETGVFIPGPYSQFAEQYLSIKNTKTKEYKYSKINNVTLRKNSIPDSECAYLIVGKKIKLQYENNGIIKSFGTFDNKNKNNQSTIEKLNIKENLSEKNNLYTDLSMHDNFSQRTDTTYRIMAIDSVITKVPVYTSKVTSKGLKDKAAEVSNLIIKIRENKFKLMSGQFETEVPPSDVKSLIEELEKLEQKYIELFTGRTIKVYNVYNYRHTPQSKQGKQSTTMFWLSEKNGVEFTEKHGNEPIILEITDNQTNKEIKNFYNRNNKIDDKAKGLYYRIPGYGNIKIIYKDHIYYQTNTIIPQFGIVNYLPSEIINDKNPQITFDTNTGFIDAISNE